MGTAVVTWEAVFTSPALPTFLQAEAAGARFKLDGGQVFVTPRGLLSAAQRTVFREHQDAVRALVTIATDEAVQARRDVFARQLDATPAPGVPAFLFRPGIGYQAGVCFSCGYRLHEWRFGRCWRCSLAWRLAARVPIPAALANALDAARVLT